MQLRFSLLLLVFSILTTAPIAHRDSGRVLNGLYARATTTTTRLGSKTQPQNQQQGHQHEDEVGFERVADEVRVRRNFPDQVVVRAEHEESSLRLEKAVLESNHAHVKQQVFDQHQKYEEEAAQSKTVEENTDAILEPLVLSHTLF